MFKCFLFDGVVVFCRIVLLCMFVIVFGRSVVFYFFDVFVFFWRCSSFGFGFFGDGCVGI